MLVDHLFFLVEAKTMIFFFLIHRQLLTKYSEMENYTEDSTIIFVSFLMLKKNKTAANKQQNELRGF